MPFNFRPETLLEQLVDPFLGQPFPEMSWTPVLVRSPVKANAYVSMTALSLSSAATEPVAEGVHNLSMAQEPAALAEGLPKQGLQAFFPLPLESPGWARSGTHHTMGSKSPVRRESSPDSLRVHTPPQTEGLKAAMEQPIVRPFPIFEQAQAPLVEHIDTHSLTLRWSPVRQVAVGGNAPKESFLSECSVGYSLEMQLVGTVS